MTKSIFENYWNEVSGLLGGRPNKSMAISLSENSQAQFDGRTVVDRLYQSLACDGWQISSGKNWEWRTEAPSYRTSSPEVALEREITAADITNQWTCQMSSASGIQGPYLTKRRAIDLVRRIAPDRYAFVELKVDSDNPLYAAFEILGYALAYRHARGRNWQGTGNHNVMHARAVDLVVLGPIGWYEYKKRGASAQQRKFKLGWLASALGDGLNSLTGDAPRMHFSFEGFTDFGEPRLTAAGIVRDSHNWWVAQEQQPTKR